MNLVYGEVVDVLHEDGMRVGRIRVGGALRRAVLDLIHEPARGDRVLLCDGIAISKVENAVTTETNHVPRHSR
jgi:hydrogenase maturation factor